LKAARQISNFPVAIFEVCHLMLHTVSIQAVVCIDMTKSIKDVCSRNLIFYVELNHSILAKR
jgi:hypothetical protein